MAGAFRVRILDVGQGDAIVSILPSGRRAVVVDVYDSDRVLNFIESENIKEVILFLTHSDTDHTAGAKDLLTALGDQNCCATLVAVFLSQDRLKPTHGYKKLLQLIGNATRQLRMSNSQNPSGDFTTQLNIAQGFADLFENVKTTVVHPDHADRLNLTGTDQNEVAGVLRFEYESSSVLLTADVQLTGISLMMSRDPSLLNADILKYPHHGAWPTQYKGITKIQPSIAKATMSEFLNAVMPWAIAFSVGRDNGDNHIHPSAIAAVDEHYRKHQQLEYVFWTQTTQNCANAKYMPPNGPLHGVSESGDIEFVLDSEGLEVHEHP